MIVQWPLIYSNDQWLSLISFRIWQNWDGGSAEAASWVFDSRRRQIAPRLRQNHPKKRTPFIGHSIRRQQQLQVCCGQNQGFRYNKRHNNSNNNNNNNNNNNMNTVSTASGLTTPKIWSLVLRRRRTTRGHRRERMGSLLPSTATTCLRRHHRDQRPTK